MTPIIRPQARDEILKARRWYEGQVPGLGLEFARAVDAAMAQITRMPLAHPPIGSNFRHVILRRFPYSIIYHASDEALVVVSCFHHKRWPGSWHEKIDH